MSLVVGAGVSKAYSRAAIEVRALRGVDFTVRPSSLVSFIGPSGSGKTTLLNLIGCLDRPTGGALTVAGADVTRLSRVEAARFRGRHIGFVFQDFNLIPVLTVFENVAYPLQLVQRVRAAERGPRVMALLDAVGMADLRDKRPDELSGGQKQRVAVARALVTNPKLVLADEPTANLDHGTAALVIETMMRMRDQFGTTFVFSTHDPRVVDQVDELFRLEDGAITGHETRTGGPRG